MKPSLKLIKGGKQQHKVGAMPSARAGRQSPSHVALSRLSERPSLSRFAPVIVHRVHRPPVARGHRCFMLGKQEWR